MKAAPVNALLLCAALCLVSSCSSPEEKLAEEGGHSLLLRVEGRVDDGGAEIPATAMEIENAIRAIEERLKAMGTTKPLIARQGENGILLKVPGADASDAEYIGSLLGKTAKLELREVSLRNDETGADGRTVAQRVLDGDELLPGYRAYSYRVEDAEGNGYASPILLNRRTALSGADIALAVPSPQQPDTVEIALNDPGTDKMIALTKNMRPGIDRIAILLDGEVLSAPVVSSVPLGKYFNISGLDGPGEAQALALALMVPLANPLTVAEIRPIPPQGK